MKTVKETFDEVYAKYGRPDTAFEQSTIENASYRDAVKRLDPKERQEIRHIAYNLSEGKKSMRNFGETSALELMAKVGIWFNNAKES